MLVSNLGQTPANDGFVVADRKGVAQGFTTGANPSGHALTSVEIRFVITDPVAVTLVSEDNGQPGTLRATLVHASSDGRVITYTAPAGTTLSANTTYFVVLNAAESDVRTDATVSDAEDSGSIANDCRIGHSSHYRVIGANTYLTANAALQIRVNGSAVDSAFNSAPGTPTNLTATPNGLTQIDLAWTAPGGIEEAEALERRQDVHGRGGRAAPSGHSL